MASQSSTPDFSWVRSLFETGQASDRSVKAAGSDKVFLVHRAVLVSQSKVFEKMLDPAGAFKESCSGASPVEIGDVTEEVLGASLGFLYGILLPTDNHRLAIDVAEFGHRMEINSLETAAAVIVSGHLKREEGEVLSGGERSADFLYALDIGKRTGNLLIRTAAIPYISKTLGFAVKKKESWIAEEVHLEDVSAVLKLFLEDVRTNRVVAGYENADLGRPAVALDFIYQWAGILTEQPASAEIEKDISASALYLSCPRVVDGSLEDLFEFLDLSFSSPADLQYIQKAMDVTGTSSHALGQKIALKAVQLMPCCRMCPKCYQPHSMTGGRERDIYCCYTYS